MQHNFIAKQQQEQRRYCCTYMLCCASRCLDGAAWLIEQGAEVNKRSFLSQQLEDESWTPLHMAATLGNLSIVRTLVQHGAQMDATTATGETVMSLALDKAGSCCESLHVVSYLIQVNTPLQSVPGMSFLIKPKLEEAVANNWTMLDFAVFSANTAAVDVLLRSGHFPGRVPKVSEFLRAVMRLMSSQQRRAMKLVEDFAARKGAPTLQSLCKDSLRAACGLRLLQYVAAIVMPGRLRSFLLLEDVLGPVDRRDGVELEGESLPS